jgi:acetylornithine/succinyldiaminopimelate/putrescine aminotransferase
LQKQCDVVREVRVRGAMIGMELAVEGAPVVKACLERKLLINCTHGTVIRLLPALTLTDQQANQGCDILCEAIKRIRS